MRPHHIDIEEAEELYERYGDYLTERDRLMLKMFAIDGGNFREIASRHGVSPETAARTIRRAIRRMSSVEFRYVAEMHRHMASHESEIAQSVYIRGITIRGTARTLVRTQHQVRWTAHAIAAAAREWDRIRGGAQ